MLVIIFKNVLVRFHYLTAYYQFTTIAQDQATFYGPSSTLIFLIAVMFFEALLIGFAKG